MKVLHSLAAGFLSATSILVRRVAFLLLFLGAGLVLVQPYASAAGVFTNTGSLNIGRSQHTATLLPNGKVLVAGGVDNNNNALASAELYDPVSGTWTATGNLNTARYLHTATLLPNGKVLVAGGLRTGNSFLASAELYDPASGTWTGTGSLADGRFGHTATLLPNGKVLVATGATNSFLASAELYDPASGTWTATGSLADGRFGHTATLLPNGKVLVAGGLNGVTGYVASAELYDPASGTWTATGSLNTACQNHTATLLPNGNVLVAGGYNASSLASAELYNPASGTWTATGSLNIARQDHTATLLPNRNVLVAGGVGTSGYLTSAELYDPASGTWTATGSLNTARYDHTATSLLNGMVLLAEGFGSSGVPASTELYRTAPSAAPTCPGPWKPAAPVGIDHYGGFIDSDATFAYEGGGYSFSVGDNINEFGRFDPVANTWTSLAPVPDLNNANASGVYAPNVNKLFVFGGENVATSTVVNTTRIYDSASNTWSIGAPMPDVRDFMGSGYYNGKIYLVGGYSTGNVDPSFGQVWEYDPVLNSFNTSRASMPITMGGPGFGIVNGHIYIAGGRNLNNNNLNTLYDYDIVADTWTQRANLPTGIEVPGSAVFIGKLWVFGGGNPFLDLATAPKSAKTGVRAWLNGLLHPDTTNILQLYDPATDTWMSGPPLNQQRSFSAGTDVGDIAVVAVGGYTGSNTTTSVEINFTTTDCASPTPTPTPTPTATHTPTPTPTFTPTATPTPTSIPTPAVTTNPATNVVRFSATLNGWVNPEGSTTTVYFQYGTTAGYGSNTASQIKTGNTYQNVSANISGLTASTTYHFRLVGMSSGGTSFGSDMTFTTMAGPPIVTTGAATNVTGSSATLHGMVNPNGLSTNVHFQYGTTTSYGLSTASQSFSGNTTQPVSANIPGLSPNTTYHFRLVGTNSGGTSFGYDVTFRFDTNAAGPVIITNPATNVMSSSATLNGTVNPRGLTTSVYFQYGASASYGFTTVAQSYSGSTTQPVSENIPGLGPSTTYHFRLVGMNSGGTSFGSDRTFTTPAAAVPPVITSPATATATVGQVFAYQLTAANGPTSYTAAPVPQGMTFDGASGMLGGTPITPGTTQIHLTASNSFGTGTRTLTLTVQSASNPGLTIVSGTTITVRTRQFFSFEVFTAGGSANARLTATHLPPGLSADPVTGLISGTPTADGSFGVTLTVTDGSATKTSTLQLTFTSDPAVPVISSPREATLVPGQFFSYRIVDSSLQSGTTFSITGQLPPGLTLNPVTGVISGVYNPHDQNGGAVIFGGQTNSHHGSKNATNPVSIFQQRPCTLLKIATRGVVQSGNNQLVGKVNITGNVSEKLMVRAIGPSLRVNGVPLTGRLLNPTLELDHPYSIGQNDNWHTTIIGGIITSNQVAAIQNSHLLNGSARPPPLVPTNLLESAIIANALAPGNYKAIVRPKSGTTGTVGSVEFYDLGPASFNLHPTAQLASFSTRSLVQTGNNVIRSDFTLGSRAGTGSPVSILLRALGPSLSVQGRLLNPTLRLYKGTGVSIAYNDNWMSAYNRQQIVNSGYAPTNNFESAILMTLSAGNYTAVVGGQNNTTGIAQLEAYILTP